MDNLSKPLTAEELSRILNISEYTVKKLAREKQIPCVMVKRRFRFDLKEILEYFKELEGGAA
jgi:excisionase family DNA binding protein